MKNKKVPVKHRFLSVIENEENIEHLHWMQTLRPETEKLAVLIAQADFISNQSETKAVDIGVKAWQTGGLGCMQFIHSIAIDICRKKCRESQIIDYVPFWWDGIGTWRQE